MAAATNSTPGTWSGLFSPEWGEKAHAPAFLKRYAALALTKANEPVPQLTLLADSLASVIVLVGPGEARAAAEQIVPLCEPALAEAGRLFQKVDPPRVALQVLSFVNAAEVCGAVQGRVEASAAKAWLESLAKAARRQENPLAYRCGFVALCLGEPELAAKLVGGGRLPGTFTPGEQFGVDVQGFIRYLATAMKQQAPADDVRPAWQSFVEGFPMIKAAERGTWSDLVWAARAWFTRFEQLPVARVGEALHTLVKPA
ncbi:hypothetical protein [Corallococcus llansteffanensis]|uniref:Uncharacterized protein n=1 Tax=Corallococcus llansteffanensis TaxID=2316731 RepID=A0A3A8P8Y8_9BACT|nr:hypothetical protein [Corallococcus llansteffanensis]RKH51830.1 hypothetical protein D7V93_28730 [Corallococcus llansteffanensis]